MINWKKIWMTKQWSSSYRSTPTIPKKLDARPWRFGLAMTIGQDQDGHIISLEYTTPFIKCLSISELLVRKTYRKYGNGFLLCISDNFYYQYLKTDFRNGGNVILLHGAIIKSNLNGLNSPRNLDVHDFRILGFVTDSWKPLFLTLDKPNYCK